MLVIEAVPLVVLERPAKALYNLYNIIQAQLSLISSGQICINFNECM